MTENNKTLDQERDADLTPIALVALESGEPIDVMVGRFAGHIELNSWGCRCVPTVVAMEHLARQYEWRKRHAEEVRQRAEEQAEIERRVPVPTGVPAIEGMTALETLAAAPGYLSPSAEFGPPGVNWLVDELDRGAAARAEAEAKAKEAAAARMRKDLQ